MTAFQKSYRTIAKDQHRGHSIRTVLYKPDVGCEVDGEFFGFFVNSKAAIDNAKRYIDEIEDKRNG